LIESEKRNPTVETLQNISRALNIPFHLLTLLATEPEDAKHINAVQVQGLATELTRLLLEGARDNERASHKANSGKSERFGASARNKKKRAA
jgi:transcriptional regulator with XRE-family HTH domain